MELKGKGIANGLLIKGRQIIENWWFINLLISIRNRGIYFKINKSETLSLFLKRGIKG